MNYLLESIIRWQGGELIALFFFAFCQIAFKRNFIKEDFDKLMKEVNEIEKNNQLE